MIGWMLKRLLKLSASGQAVENSRQTVAEKTRLGNGGL